MNAWIREKRLDAARRLLQEAGRDGVMREDLQSDLLGERSIAVLKPASARKAASRTIKWLEDHGEVLHDVDGRLYWRSA